MKEVKLSNGVAIIKDFCSYKTKKEVSACLFGDTTTNSDGKSNLKYSDLQNANDMALLKMVESLMINGQQMAVSQATFDEMNNDDIVLLTGEVMAIINKQIPNA